MGQSNSEGSRRPRVETEYEEARQEIMRQVFQATNEGSRSKQQFLLAKYQTVVERWRGAPWNPETIGRSLVEVALTSWCSSLQYSLSAQQQLMDDIADALFQDPHSAAKLEAWWNSLLEASA